MFHPSCLRALFSGMLLLFICTAALPAGATSETLIFRGDHNYPPYEFMNAQNEPDGFNVELLRVVATRMGLLVNIDLGPWHEVRTQLENGEIDGLLGMFKTPARDEKVDFTIPHIVASYAVFVPRDSKLRSIEEAEDAVIFVQKGDLGHDYLLEHKPNARVTTRESVEKALISVANKEGDCALVPRLQAQILIKEKIIPGLTAVGPPIIQRKYCVAVTEGDAPLLAVLNEGLSIVKTSGEYDRIYDKWFGVYEERPLSIEETGKYVLMVAGPLLTLVLLAFIWNRALRKKVNERTGALYEANRELKREMEERMKAVTALAAGEARYREIYNAPNECIFIHDPEDGRIVDVNRAVLTTFGYTRDEILAMSVEDMSAGSDAFSMKQALGRIRQAAHGTPVMFEWLCKRSSGELFWAEVSLKYSKVADSGFVIAIVRDVSERKRAREKLSQEKELLAVTLKSIGEGVITCDINGTVLMMNRVAERLTGRALDESRGKPVTEVFRVIPGKNGSPAPNPVERVLRTGLDIPSSDSSTLLSSDGKRITIADSASPIMDEKSRMIGVVLVFRDVTEKSMMEAELLKIKKLESVGVLAGGIAHDFNNILTAILGSAGLVKKLGETDKKIRALAANMEKACLRAKDLTQQLLTFSKGGTPVLRSEEIGGVIRESADFVLHGSNVRCDLSLARDLMPVKIDAGQISQVVQNLILNAKDAMPGGGIVRVTCENHANGGLLPLPLSNQGYVRITLRDNGDGIPPELQERIFDPYFSTKQEGSGLGLAVTHSIITKHNGHIRVESTRGEGTAFFIYLPASDTLPEASAPSPPHPTGMGMGMGTILIMDDEEIIREMAGELLAEMGFCTLTASSGNEALEIYLEDPDSVDLVLMDLTIPGGMGGKEAAARILERDPHARLIVSSGYSHDPIMANHRKHGFRAAIVKPYLYDELWEKISRVLAS